MKRKCFVFILTVFVLSQVFAVPAHKGSVKVSQPDGSVVTLLLHGDEYLHFTTTDDGYSVVKNEQGAYVYAQLDDEGQLAPTAIVAHDAAERKVAELAYLQGVEKGLKPAMTAQSNQMLQTNRALAAKARQAVAAKAPQYDYNNFRGLVILVEFNDKQFSRTDYKEIMNDMINQENYTGFTGTNGRKQTYTGSVRDYFSDNSGGKFKPQFDVYGPYKVNYSQYYPQSTRNAGAVLSAAVTAADADINYANYDRDGDGAVDMIFFMLAGNGANYGGNDSRLWWPHRSVLYNNGYVIKDGVYLWDYASTVELAGYTGYPSTVMIDGIGTICHEFSHVLGLPDFYDADYDGSGGESNHPDTWSVMAGGSYLNNGRTPVGYSLFERYAMGFTTPEVISAEGDYSLPAISSSNTGYRINTLGSKEYFMLENRQRSAKWDAYLPGDGMLVFRVDSTNAQIWEQNAVNNNPAHNYYELLRAGGYQSAAAASDPFPGTKRVRTLNVTTSPASLMGWSGSPAEWGLENIQEKNGVITFSVLDVNVLKSVELPEAITLKQFFSTQLEPVCTPSYALKSLTWESDCPEVATVSAEGVVKGISVGTANIKVTANEELVATCCVTVEAPTIIPNIAEYRELETGERGVLALTDAEVLCVHGTNIYVRDATGCLVLVDSNVEAQPNDVLNGIVSGELAVSNDVYKLIGESGVTPDVVAVAGEEVTPRVVVLDSITTADYSDLITIPGVKLQKTSYSGLSGVYAVSEENDIHVRIFNTFGLTSSQITMPSNYNKSYDITGILTPRVQSGKVVMELGVLRSPTEAVPTGIDAARPSASGAAPVYYTLTGSRVSNVAAPGLYIVQQGGKLRKVLVK